MYHQENQPIYPDKEASWNSALESAKRLSYWIQLGNQHYYDKNYSKYKDCLMIFFKEISSKLKPKELDEVFKHIKLVFDEENNYNKELLKGEEDENITFTSKYPILLDTLDIVLRMYADKKGLLIPDKKSIFDSEE